jgi:hypothetical protein
MPGAGSALKASMGVPARVKVTIMTAPSSPGTPEGRAITWPMRDPGTVAQ